MEVTDNSFIKRLWDCAAIIFTWTLTCKDHLVNLWSVCVWMPASASYFCYFSWLMTANFSVVVRPKMIESRKFQVKECFAVTCLQPWDIFITEHRSRTHFSLLWLLWISALKYQWKHSKISDMFKNFLGTELL